MRINFAAKWAVSYNYDENIKRTRNLVAIYKKKVAGRGGGRRDVGQTDVLRAAVVLLHATLEDMLRTLEGYLLPHASEGTINEVPLLGQEVHGRPEKFFLGALSKHRQKSVDTLIKESVSAHLADITYNDTTEIISRLNRLGLNTSRLKPFLSSLDDMIRRRHSIVHKADRNEAHGVGHFTARSLAATLVVRWINAVDGFYSMLRQAVDSWKSN